MDWDMGLVVGQGTSVGVRFRCDDGQDGTGFYVFVGDGQREHILR